MKYKLLKVKKQNNDELRKPDDEGNVSQRLLNSHMDIDLFPSAFGSKEKVYRTKIFRGLELPDSGKVMQ